MNKQTTYIALETRTVTAAVRTIKDESIYTLLTGSFLKPMRRLEAMSSVEWLLREIERRLWVNSNRLMGRMILPSTERIYGDRTFERFSLAFRGHSSGEIGSIAAAISNCTMTASGLKARQFSRDLQAYDLSDYLTPLRELEAQQLEADWDPQHEGYEATLLYFGAYLEWHFFRDQSFDQSHLGVVASALGAQFVRPDTFAIPGY